jgi:hypothetical protein
LTRTLRLRRKLLERSTSIRPQLLTRLGLELLLAQLWQLGVLALVVEQRYLVVQLALTSVQEVVLVVLLRYRQEPGLPV